MLELKIEGEEHPKTVKLVTDDAQGELADIEDTFDEGAVKKGNAFRAWFDDASPEDFKQGVIIPQDVVADFQNVLEEAEQFDAAEQIEDLRSEAMGEIERKMGERQMKAGGSG